MKELDKLDKTGKKSGIYPALVFKYSNPHIIEDACEVFDQCLGEDDEVLIAVAKDLGIKTTDG